MQQAAKGGEKEVQEVPSVCTGDKLADTFCSVYCVKFEEFLVMKWKSGTCVHQCEQLGKHFTRFAIKTTRLAYLL
jgi:hypothetical protein